MANDSTTQISDLRIDTYGFSDLEQLAESLVSNYTQQDYEGLRDIAAGEPSTGMQMGGILAANIVEYMTAFEISELPTVVITDSTGKTEVDLTSFAQKFLHEQHDFIVQGAATKNLYGDAYMTFTPGRDVEIISPEFCDPAFAHFSNTIVGARIFQNRYIVNPDTGKKVKIKLARYYKQDVVEYLTSLDTKSKLTKNIQIKPKIVQPNPLGVCPVIHLPNRQRAGYQFGWSDFYGCIPFFLIFHKVLKRGFESQQYSGKPIFVISGIQGPVPAWIQRTFGIDINNVDTDLEQSKVMQLLKKHKMFFLADNVTAEFIESKVPIGKTSEILDICIKQIARVSGIPEFLFGAGLEASSASTREQYSGLKGIIRKKQVAYERALNKLIRWAFVIYSTNSKNEETNEPLETYGLWNSLEDGLEFKVDLHWPEMIGSDERIKNESLVLMANAGAISRQTLGNNFQKLIPNAVDEQKKLLEEKELFGVEEENKITDNKEQTNTKQRRRDDQGNNKDGKDGSK